MLGTTGMMPQQKINEKFESLDNQLNGLTGEVLAMNPKFKIDLLNLTMASVENPTEERKRQFLQVKQDILDSIPADT